MVKDYWRKARSRAWQETRHAFRWESTERVVIQVSVAAVALVVIWVVGGENSWGTIIARLIGTAAIVFAVPVVFTRKLVTVPAVMDAELRTELERLRTPEGGPQPDWTISELFTYLKPPDIDDKSEWYEAVGSDVLDKVTSGHLTLWGRERISRTLMEAEWSSLFPIAPSHCKRASFAYLFVMDQGQKPHLQNAGRDGFTEFADLRVNRAEARRLWPRSGR